MLTVCFVYNVVDRSLLVVARFVWWSKGWPEKIVEN
jgi:hypothetical protein